SKPDVPGRIVCTIDFGRLEDALNGGKRNLGVVTVDIKCVDRPGHSKEVWLAENEAHFRISFEQRDAAFTLTRGVESADLEMSIESVSRCGRGSACYHRSQIGHRGAKSIADERQGRRQLGIKIVFRD